MRRVVIIGNGFDIAHGIKTSYYDFIQYLILESINGSKSIRKELFDAGYLYSENSTYEYIKNNFGDIATEKEYNLSNKIFFKNKLLLKIMLRFFEANWFDIETLYYEELCQCLNSSKYNGDLLEETNSDFATITKFLEKYLNSRFENKEINLIPEIKEILKSGNPESLYLINFNYTPIARMYLDILNEIEDKSIVHINGELYSEENPLIFGYGDSTDSKYLEILSKNNNSFLENLKQHKYKNWDSYDNIFEYLDKGNFEIFSIGHSLGLSDKTLLKEIFEHVNLNKIQLFHHKNKKGLENLRNNLSRIINLTLLNKKLNNFKEFKIIPQAKKVLD